MKKLKDLTAKEILKTKGIKEAETITKIEVLNKIEILIKIQEILDVEIELLYLIDDSLYIRVNKKLVIFDIHKTQNQMLHNILSVI